jgi:predicted RNase H-like HicB family nuclease
VDSREVCEKARKIAMAESLIGIQIEALSEGGYVATSEDLPGLVAQGRTIAECIEIAQDVARKLVESFLEHGDPLPPKLRAQTPGSIGIDIPVGIP